MATSTSASAQISEPTSSSESGPVYFWREYDEPDGFLSQWYDSSFEHDGIMYRSAEMWMMTQKAKLFGDEEIAGLMMKTTDPAEHKALGRKVKGFNREKWDQNKLRIVEEGNWWKFTANKEDPSIKEKLLATGDRELVEASPFDRIWGIGFGKHDAESKRDEWGENLLGIALMNVRKRLQEQRHSR